jgi:CDP-diacylglycerol---serine O-phosphatidyltransferase
LSLPLGWKSYRDQKRAYEAAHAPAASATATAATASPAPSLTPPVVEAPPSDDRPERLH